MAIFVLSLHTYKQRDRIIVQYYNSGKESECLCPECSWRGEIENNNTKLNSCIEIKCPNCETALGMVSSQLPKDWLENRCI